MELIFLIIFYSTLIMEIKNIFIKKKHYYYIIRDIDNLKTYYSNELIIKNIYISFKIIPIKDLIILYFEET